MKKMLSLLSACGLTLGGLACGTGAIQADGSPAPGTDPGSSISTSTSSLAVFHTRSALKVGRSDSERVRIKIEDYYPAACFDSDDDHDGVPDSVDACPPASDDSSGLRCKRCNRGPGTQGDLRLRIRGSEGELQRGRVLARNGSELTVPTPDGALTIRIEADTRIDDGEPNPGAEIRVEGRIEGTGGARVLVAERLKVLCPAPAAIPEEEVPAEATPIQVEGASGTATGCEGGNTDGGTADGETDDGSGDDDGGHGGDDDGGDDDGGEDDEDDEDDDSDGGTPTGPGSDAGIN